MKKPWSKLLERFGLGCWGGALLNASRWSMEDQPWFYWVGQVAGGIIVGCALASLILLVIEVRQDRELAEEIKLMTGCRCYLCQKGVKQ